MTCPLPLSALLPEIAGIPPDLTITGLVQDSREVQPGNAFIAIAGAATHGLHFAADALKQGAATVLYAPPIPDDAPQPPDKAIAVPGLRARLGAMADQFHTSPSHAMTVIGVTGTSGKTSIVQFLAQALETLNVRSGSIGTLGAGLHGKLQTIGFTTPLVLNTHALLAQLRDAGAKAIAMEVSSHALDQGRVDGVHFEIAVFSNLSRDHLDYHGNMESYGAAKAQLFVRDGIRTAVINIDDDFGATLPGRILAQTITVSATGRKDAKIAAHDVNLDERGLRFTLRIANNTAPVESPLIGRFNLDNLLLVSGVLHAMHHDITEISGALNQLQPVPGRMNRFGGHAGLPLVVVDYSHKPAALQQALMSLREHLGGKLICVFGCGGERDTGKRPLMAAIAERHAEYVYVTDDNPRHEDGDAIVRDILAGFSDRSQIHVERNRARAIEQAIGFAGTGDIILVAGKGHETYQDIAGVKHPFDDALHVQAALKLREVLA